MVEEQIWVELLNLIRNCCALSPSTYTSINVKWWVSLLKQSHPFTQMCSDIKLNLFIFISITWFDGNESFYSQWYHESLQDTGQCWCHPLFKSWFLFMCFLPTNITHWTFRVRKRWLNFERDTNNGFWTKVISSGKED